MCSINRFFTSFALSLPFFGSQTDFMQWESRRLSTLAIAFMGHNCVQGAEAGETAEALSYAQGEWNRVVHGQEWELLPSRPAQALDVLAGTLVLAYGHYGRHSLPESEQCMTRFLELALACRLTQLDRPGQTGPLIDWAHRTGKDAVVRRLWTDFLAADVMMHISTSGTMRRQFNPAQHEVLRIDSALDVGFEQDPNDADAAYRARLAVVKLMYESVRGPSMSSSGAPDLNRLASVDRMIGNLISDTQQGWMACLRSPPKDCCGDDLRAHGARQAILFDSLVAAHAARIHLHRRAWFGDLPLDLDSCSFRWKGDPPPLSQASHPSGYVPDPASLQSSVHRMVEAADSILLLTQVDSQRAFERVMAQQANPSDLHFLPIHWPVWGCCQMVASYAYVVMVAAGANCSSAFQPGSVIPATATLPPRLGQEQGEWRKSEAVSNMAFCEATLGHGSKVFPLYRIFRAEIHRCRLAVDASAKHTL